MFPAVFAIFIHFSGDRACIKDYVFIDLAYNTGRMTAEEYKAITGKYPAGYQPAYVPLPDPEPDNEEDEEIVVNDITMKGIRDTIYRSGSKAAAREALRKSPDIVDAMSDDQWKQVQSWIMQMG